MQNLKFLRTRWAALGAAVAVSLGGGGLWQAAYATVSSGDKPVFVAISPCRLLDTRLDGPQVGPRGAALQAGEIVPWSARGTNGSCSIPNDASAIMMNMTIVAPTAGGFLTIWPSDQPKPSASSLNWVAGQAPTPNAVTVKLSAAGQFSAFISAGQTNLLADITGYFVSHNHDDRYYTKAEIGQRTVVTSGEILLGQLQYYGDLIYCPAGTVVSGTGAQSPGIQSFVLTSGSGAFVGYFVSNDLPLTVTAEVQAICMQAPSGGSAQVVAAASSAEELAKFDRAVAQMTELAEAQGFTKVGG